MTSRLERLLERDHLAVIGALLFVIVVSWIYTLSGAGMDMSAVKMTEMSGPTGSALKSDMPMSSMDMTMQRVVAWTMSYVILMVFMWWIMMIAMMLPSAAPTILLYASISRRQQDAVEPFVPTGTFAVGYLLAWGAFSVIATGLQWYLTRSGLLSSAMSFNNLLFGGLVLLAAGIWQFTPLKHACLRHCRSPMDFLSRTWRSGRSGALAMGLEHGAYCLGCCWVLMCLLFVGGVMNLYWIIGLALFVLIEKNVRVGETFARIAGVGFLAWGGAMIWLALA